MFLQKELFEDDPRAPLARPSSSAGFKSASSTRPGTAGSMAGAASEDGEEITTPGSLVNMRAKMMQQRERLLAKQKSGGLGGGMAVMANRSIPAEVSTPKSKTPAFSQSLSSSSAAAMLSGVVAEDPKHKGSGGLVTPAPPPATKEDEEARRQRLAQDLIDRGICPEFDPAGSGDQRSNFDIGSMAPSDMRAFLHAPVPKHAGTLQCRIVRDRSGISSKLHPKYVMESDSGIFLMTAQKQVKNKTSNYTVSMSTASSKDADAFLGKLRSDFLGIEWVAYGPGLNPSKVDSKLPAAHAMQQVREELVAVQYTASKWGATSKGPRKMGVVMPHMQPRGERLVCQTLTPQSEGLLALLENGGSAQLIDTYNNKPPKWNDTIGAYVLNFNKRVTEASVKNFQLISTTDSETVYLQFGRVGKEVFNLDFRYPISPFQAFTMCLSSFDYKLGCE